jgi:murein DD-endopeptidase MepM/ murein hydrolase activator NlpD
MKKLLFILPLLAVIVGLAAPAARPRRETQSLAFQGIPMELVFRALQPGEVILAELKQTPPVKKLVLQVQAHRYVLDGRAPGAKPFALIGIDVATKPEPLLMRITEEKPDGTVKKFREELSIEAKEFSRKRFYVNEAMLAPPAKEQERVKREQELVAAVYGIITSEWLGTGSFMSPIPDREAAPNFGQQRIYNKSYTSIHQGVDIAAPWGSPVRASNSGRAVLASSLYLSGKTVIIDHGQGVFSLYCHFSQILVKRGDLVKKGQVIARVGNTGRSTGPHLHWGIRILDSRVDPFSLVSLPLRD